ncbi:sigma-54 interaction domain-containing protein [Planctomycetota bacterium]
MGEGGNAELESPSVLYRERRITFDGIWTRSPAMAKCIKQATLAAPHDVSVLILGENGTGKNLVAQAIHNASPRRRGPFVPVDMGGFQESLFVAELFGRERGAYTDARDARAGYFEEAEGGTLFLDEIGNLTPSCQEKLLASVERKEIRRVGGSKPIQCDVRLVTATNAELEAAVESGAFRRDLYYRIAQLVIKLPPLRDRLEDIELLAARFLAKANEDNGREVERISKECLTHMLDYPWPGNVRELRIKVNVAMIFCSGDELRVADMFPEQEDDGPHRTAAGMELALETMERRHVSKVLKMTGWNVTRAAELLGISRPTLYKKIMDYKLERPSDVPPYGGLSEP